MVLQKISCLQQVINGNERFVIFSLEKMKMGKLICRKSSSYLLVEKHLGLQEFL
jgi:hypothetical protein